MKCNTIRPGKECGFMGRKDCKLPEKKCYPVVEFCKGCGKIENDYCKSYAHPQVKWEMTGACPLATHIEKKAEEEKKKLNPIKASKKSKKK